MTNPSGIGASVPRKEDPAFLTGAGCFTDDIRRDGVAHGLVVRSPYPHARIARIDVAAARAAPGVLAVLTAADIAEDVPNPIPSFANTPPFNIATRDGAALPDAEQYPLARERVRYVGEPVVFVVAETLAQARDAAELVTVDYDELPAVVDYDQALAADATPIWPEHGGNLSFDWEGGDGPATDAAFAAAAHVAKVELDNNRVAITFMEPRAALAEIDPDNGRLTLHVGCQGAHGIQAILAQMLEIDAKELRVVAPDTGGGFGARGGVYAEFPLTLVAARRLGRAVKWTAERGEGFLADCQARDHILRGELALDADGRFTALRVAVDWRHGAYLTSRIAWVIVAYLPPTLGGVYGVPLGHFRIRGLFANATPQSAYRGVGRLESNYLMESLVDAAARQTGIDRVELRRRNLVAPEGMPWTAPGGAVYTSGQFADNLDRALELADWAGFPARRQAAEARGLLAGIGLGMFAENDGSTPTEYAEVEAAADGRILAFVGTQDFGMGHATVISQILSDELGVDFDDIGVVYGDTDRVTRGAGSHGSRSVRMAGSAAVFGAREMVERGRELAAELLEASAADIDYAAGRFTIAGTDRAVSLAEVAGFARDRGERLAADADFNVKAEVHSNGCHVCEVTVDPDTGRVSLVRYTAVADVGRAVNPMIVHGQLHGGAAQGIGQALLERVVQDPASGQVLTGSFMDYGIPRADDLVTPAIALNEVVEADNPIGAKGAGESATTGAPAAVMNAIRDALVGAGAEAPQMPATPERVWRCLRRAGR